MKLGEARIIANKIVDMLSPHCRRIMIAGSIRRNREEVGDIEIVALPKTIEEPDGLFDTKQIVLPEFMRLVNSWKREKGNPDGRYCQRVIELDGHEPIKLDLFLPTYEDFFRQVVVRTGSKDYSRFIIAAGWLKRGWCGTKDGLRLQSECKKNISEKWECITETPTLPPVWSDEKEFFEWLGVPYLEPEKRNHIL